MFNKVKTRTKNFFYIDISTANSYKTKKRKYLLSLQKIFNKIMFKIRLLMGELKNIYKSTVLPSIN